jgi:hypothetical protein
MGGQQMLRMAYLRIAGVFALALGATIATSPPAVRAEVRPPIKLAVFPFELDDFSAGGPIAGESAVETERLKRVTDQARRQLARSGLFEIIDASAATDEMVKARWLRKCNGCEADVARNLGAEMSFLAFFRKISVMEQYLEFRIRDARSGQLVNVSQTDLRGETDESWSRAIAFLIRYNLVEPELSRRSAR